MRSDDIHSLEDLALVIGEDLRFKSFELCGMEDGVLEVRAGEAGLAFAAARAFTDRDRLEHHLTRSRNGATRLVLIGSEDELAAAAELGDGTEMSLWVLPMSRARAAISLPMEMD